MDIKSKIKVFFTNLWTKIKNFNIQDCRVSFINGMKSLESNGKILVVTVISAVIVMFLTCLFVFFATVKGPEKVLVPTVKGKELTQALLEMQVKELYPKIQLRYPENQEEFGIILDQSPVAGAIVKAGTRVTLTVSRGAVISEIGNYVGQNFDELKLNLTTMFTGYSKPLIVLADPIYKPDLSEAGTILEQEPAEGTKISNPVTVHLVVSRGPNYENTRVPNLKGKTLEEILSYLSQSKVVLDFTSRITSETEKSGIIISQQEIEEEFIPNFSRIAVEIAFPEKNEDDLIYGLFSAKLADYPYPVDMELEAKEKDGNRYIITSFKHIGGNITVPYAVESGTEILLKVAGKEARRITVIK
ncbi:MAG: PASTA domain-containing protein [Treponema sp.]|nr:PASTA domain-containing protein [Treponema sp.]